MSISAAGTDQDKPSLRAANARKVGQMEKWSNEALLTDYLD